MRVGPVPTPLLPVTNIFSGQLSMSVIEAGWNNILLY